MAPSFLVADDGHDGTVHNSKVEPIPGDRRIYAGRMGQSEP